MELLQDGHHVPTLIVEGSRNTVIMPITDLNRSHEGRVRQLFTTGVTLARRDAIGIPEQAFFITEAWMSTMKGKATPVIPPSKNADRQEVLFVSNLDLMQGQSRAIMFEMIRDSKNNLMEVNEMRIGDREQPAQVENPLLVAFVHGFALGLRK